MSAVGRTWLGFVGVLAAAAALVVLAGQFPVGRQGGATALRGLWLGCLVSLMAAAAGSVPLARLVGQEDQSGVVAAVGKATLIRFTVTLGAALWLVSSGWVETRPLLLSVAVSYLALLAVETWWLLRSLRKAPNTDGGTAAM
jgi:hypothetical protein